MYLNLKKCKSTPFAHYTPALPSFSVKYSLAHFQGPCLYVTDIIYVWPHIGGAFRAGGSGLRHETLSKMRFQSVATISIPESH